MWRWLFTGVSNETAAFSSSSGMLKVSKKNAGRMMTNAVPEPVYEPVWDAADASVTANTGCSRKRRKWRKGVHHWRK